MKQIYRVPSPNTRKRKAQELLAKHALAWEANLEHASVIRNDSRSIMKFSNLYREKVRLDALNEARRLQRINLSWEASLRTLQTTQVVPVGNRFSGLQCVVSNDPNAIRIQNLINMPEYRDPVQDLPDDLRAQVDNYKSSATQRAISRAKPPTCDLPDTELNVRNQFNKLSVEGSQNSRDPTPSTNDAMETSEEKDVDTKMNSARTNSTSILGGFTSKGQRLPAGTAAQKADKIAQYINEKNNHIISTYIPELRWDINAVNTSCITEPIAFASQELHPRVEISNLTVVTYNSREKTGCNVATITIRNTGDSVVSLQLVPKGSIDLTGFQADSSDDRTYRFRMKDVFHEDPRSPESTRSLLTTSSNAPVHRLRQNLGVAPSSSVNRILDLVTQEPRRYQNVTSVTSYTSLGATVNIVGAGSVQSLNLENAKNALEAKRQAFSGTLTSNLAPAQIGIDAKKLLQKSTTPIELRILAARFLKQNKGTETSLIVSVPSSVWALTPGCSTEIRFILPYSESGVAVPGIILREYYILTSPAVDVSLLSLEDIIHANRLVETSEDGTTTKITVRCYGIASDFLQVGNSICSLSKRGTRLMSDLYLKQMCAELLSELLFLAMEVSRVTALEEATNARQRGLAKYKINAKAMQIHERGVINASWAGTANEMKALLSDLVTECEGADLSVYSILSGYIDGYFSDEMHGLPYTPIKQRRIFGVYHLAVDPEAPDPSSQYHPHALVSSFNYLFNQYIGVQGYRDMQSNDSGASKTLQTSILPPMQIPTTARFAFMKVESRFKAANEALTCSVKRFYHEALPTKQLLFYKNSPFYLKLASYSNFSLKVLIMPMISNKQQGSSPGLEPEQISSQSPLFWPKKSTLSNPTQALQLDVYRQSSLALITEHIVSYGFCDDSAELVTLSSLEEIEYEVFKRGVAHQKEILALTAPIVPTLLTKFLLEKIGSYCQLLLEAQTVKVMNRGKNVPRDRLLLMSDGLLSVSARPSWAENLSILVSMAAATSSSYPVSTIFGDHISAFDDATQDSFIYLVKLRHLLELKATSKTGSFVPLLWDAVCQEFRKQRRDLSQFDFISEGPNVFQPRASAFAIRVFYDRLRVTCKTVAEEEALRLEAEKAKKSQSIQKPVVLADDSQDTGKDLSKFKGLFMKHVYYVNQATNETYDGASLLTAISEMNAPSDGNQLSSPLLVEEDGIPEQEVDSAMQALVMDLAELMLRETLYLNTMLGRAYLPLIYKLQEINSLDPENVASSITFPHSSYEWTHYIENQYTPFHPEHLSTKHRSILYAHYDLTLFGDRAPPANRYHQLATSSTRYNMKRNMLEYSESSHSQRYSMSPFISNSEYDNYALYLMTPPDTSHKICDYIVLDKPVIIPVTDAQLLTQKKPQAWVFTEPRTTSVKLLTTTPTLSFELDPVLCATGLSPVLKTSYLKAEPISASAPEPTKKSVKSKEDPVLLTTSLHLPKTFLGIYFADADPSTLASRLFSRAFFDEHSQFLMGLDSDSTNLALSDALECLAITALQPVQRMPLNHALLDATFAAIQLSAFPVVKTFETIIHYITVISFKHARSIFEKQFSIVNSARQRLRTYVTNICTCLFARSVGLSFPLPAVQSAPSSSASTKNKGADATTLALVQLVESFREAMSEYLLCHFSSEVVFLDPNLLLHLGRLLQEDSKFPPDITRMQGIFSQMKNYTNLSIYDYGPKDFTPFTTERPTTTVKDVDESFGEDQPKEEKQSSSHSQSNSAHFQRRKGTKLVLDIASLDSTNQPYLGLSAELEEVYLDSLTPCQVEMYQLSKEFYGKLGGNPMNLDRFIKKTVEYTPEFSEALNIEALVYELKLASFRREFDTFIDSLFTHYTEDLITEHCDGLRLYEDELDEYELMYHKLVGIANGEMTIEEAGIDAESAVPPSSLPVPTKPCVSLYPVFQSVDLQNERDSCTINRYVGFTYSSSFKRTSLEYLVDGLILTLLELLPIAKRFYRSQAPDEYYAQGYDQQFDDAAWSIINACGYTKEDVEKIEARYALPDVLPDAPLDIIEAVDDEDGKITDFHTSVSDVGKDDLSEIMPTTYIRGPQTVVTETSHSQRDAIKRHNGDGNGDEIVKEGSTAQPESGVENTSQYSNQDSKGEICRNDADLYKEPPSLQNSMRIPVEALEKLCALFNIKPDSLTSARYIKENALHPVESKICPSISTVELSITSFVEDIQVRSLTSFESLYRYLNMHVSPINTSSGVSKVARMPAYMSLLTPSGLFGTVFADSITQPSTTKCTYIVDITEENALLLAKNLNIAIPKPEKDTKAKANLARGDGTQKEAKSQGKSVLVPKEGQNLLDVAAEGLIGTSKFHDEKDEYTEEDDLEMEPSEPEYVVPMNKPVELETAARRDVWGTLFDRFLDRAFAWVDACNKVPELVVKVINYSVRDFNDFIDQ